MNGIRYRRVSLSVRPPRLVLLVERDAAWVDHAREVLRIFSQLWGGLGHIAIPYDAEGIAQEYLPLLSLHDPDILAQLVLKPTTSDPHLPEPVISALDRHTAPFVELFPRNRERRVVRMSPDSRTYSHMSSLLDAALLPETRICRVFETVSLPQLASLMLTFRMGELSPVHESDLQSKGVAVQRTPTDVVLLTAMYPMLMNGLLEHTNAQWTADPEFIGQVAPALSPEEAANVRRLFRHTPLGRTKHGCNWYPSTRHRFDYQRVAPACIYVVGDSVDDFYFALAIDRLAQCAAWVPSFLLSSELSITSAIRRQVEAIVAQHGDLPIWITSFSESPSNLEGLAASITPSKRIKELVSVIQPSDLAVTSCRRVMDRQQVEQVRFVPFEGSIAQEEIDPPSPEDIVPLQPWRFGWVTDAEVDFGGLPQHDALRELVTEGWGASKFVRSGRDGIAFWNTVRASVLGTKKSGAFPYRPRLVVPSGVEIFASMLGQGDFEASLSDKGRYLTATIGRWDNFETALARFRDRTTRRVIEAFCTVEKVNTRRLTAQDLKSATKGSLTSTELRDLCDDLLDRGVLIAGSVIQCEDCRFRGWYAYGDFASTFTCTRCRRTAVVKFRSTTDAGDRFALRGPATHFRLDEVVFQTVSNNGHLVLLTLGTVWDRARQSFIYVPELRLKKGDELAHEIDVFCVDHGDVILGEVSSSSQPKLSSSRKEEKQRVAFLKDAVEATHAKTFLLASSTGEWDPKSRETLRSALGPLGCEVTMVAVGEARV